MCALFACVSQTAKEIPAATRHDAPVNVRKVTPPRPGQDLPNPESFYPVEAKRLFQEGTSTIHFCVDAAGRLSGPPTISVSSGNPDLDSAAILLATAGNGHYTAATQNGINVQGCGAFRIRFRMPEDPRWPILSRKLILVNAQFVRQSDALNREWGSLRMPTDLDLSDPNQLATVRQFAVSASTALSQSVGLLTDYIAQTDRTSRADDIPETERNAFAAYWGPQRELFIRSSDEIASAMRSMVSIMNEVVHYFETSKPPLTSSSGAVTPTARQRAHIDSLIKRGRASYEKFEAAMQKLRAESERDFASETQ
jgi:TonB family protein